MRLCQYPCEKVAAENLTPVVLPAAAVPWEYHCRVRCPQNSSLPAK